jgi:5-(carboxyamino)imidazole ribonucleotide mutase
MKSKKSSSKPLVAVIMGSKTDWPVMQNAAKVLSDFGVDTHVEIVSAHRTPVKMQEFARAAEGRGFQIIIAGAGGAAHLPGMVASHTRLPVIGVPITIGKLKGLDALLSIAQMPKGVPVATMAVDNSANAGLLAVRILALQNENLKAKLARFETQQRKKVSASNRTLRKG